MRGPLPIAHRARNPAGAISSLAAGQKVTLQEGIPSDKAREIVKVIKNSKIKVQASIQGEQVRVTSKSRDDLQSVMQLLKSTDLGIDMQFTNRR